MTDFTIRPDHGFFPPPQIGRMDTDLFFQEDVEETEAARWGALLGSRAGRAAIVKSGNRSSGICHFFPNSR